MSPCVRLLDHFSALEDPREGWRVLYPLPEIVLLVLCATLAGMEDFVEIRLWGQERLEFLRRFLPFERGIPSHDVLNDVLNGLDAELFKRCFASWVETLRDADPEIIAIDGKTSRRTHARKKGVEPLHLVSAWASRQRLVLGQQAVADKSNEIIAIPLLLQRLELTGALVTIDAMGTQIEIARTITDGGGDYLLSLKANWPALLAEVETFFADPANAPDCQVFDTVDADHGRLEQRRHRVCHKLDWLALDPRLPAQRRLPRRAPLPAPDPHRHGRGPHRARRKDGAGRAFYIASAKLDAKA